MSWIDFKFESHLEAFEFGSKFCHLQSTVLYIPNYMERLINN